MTEEFVSEAGVSEELGVNEGSHGAGREQEGTGVRSGSCLWSGDAFRVWVRGGWRG